MNDLDNCPHCQVSLIGDPIPEAYKDLYKRTHFRRDIGVEYPDRYDGIWEFKCPDCGGTWPSEVARTKKPQG